MSQPSGKRVAVWVQGFPDRKNLVLQWHDPETGKRRSKSAGTSDERVAEKARADLEYELNNRLYKEASRISWEAFRELFEREYAAGKRPNTQMAFRATLDLFEDICAPKKLASVSERTVSAFVAGMRERPGRRKGQKGLLASTIAIRLHFLHTALGWAAGQKMIPAVPQFPRVDVPDRDPQAVPGESFERLLGKAPDRQTEAFLLCGWLAGLRLCEAHALEWEETDEAPYVDFRKRRVIFPAGFVKAKKDQWVPLDEELEEALRQLPRRGKRVFSFRGPDEREVCLARVSQRVRDLARRAGVRLTYHTLRKGFGCRYAAKVPAQVLQKLMRHGNIRTTMKYYANIDDAVEQAVLGTKRNSSRNSGGAAEETRGYGSGANSYGDSGRALGSG